MSKLDKVMPVGAFCENQISTLVFDAWLRGKAETTSGAVYASKTPREALQEMVDAEMQVDAPDGTQAVLRVLEGIMIRYVTLALQGNLSAIQGIYKELQHDGVDKKLLVNIEHITPGMQFVLDQVGYMDAIEDAAIMEGL